jgi:hypothetical protein
MLMKPGLFSRPAMSKLPMLPVWGQEQHGLVVQSPRGSGGPAAWPVTATATGCLELQGRNLSGYFRKSCSHTLHFLHSEDSLLPTDNQ